MEYGESGAFMNRKGGIGTLTDVIWLLKSDVVGIHDLKAVIP